MSSSSCSTGVAFAVHARSGQPNLIPAVPFCHLTFLAVRPSTRRYERTEVREGTLGAAFRARRWSRGLDQKAAAKEIGVTHATYCNWEVNRTEPDLRHMPAAIRFLGFDWRPKSMSLGARIRRIRTAAGLSIRTLAAIVGLDPSTLGECETGFREPSRRSAAKLEACLPRS